MSGMTCAACARTIERTLAKTPGVGAGPREFRHIHRHRGIRSGAGAGPGDFIGAIERFGLPGPRKPTPADAEAAVCGGVSHRGGGLRDSGAGGWAWRSVRTGSSWCWRCPFFYAGRAILRRGVERPAPPLGQHEHTDRARYRHGLHSIRCGDGARWAPRVFRGRRR